MRQLASQARQADPAPSSRVPPISERIIQRREEEVRLVLLDGYLVRDAEDERRLHAVPDRPGPSSLGRRMDIARALVGLAQQRALRSDDTVAMPSARSPDLVQELRLRFRLEPFEGLAVKLGSVESQQGSMPRRGMKQPVVVIEENGDRIRGVDQQPQRTLDIAYARHHQGAKATLNAERRLIPPTLPAAHRSGVDVEDFGERALGESVPPSVFLQRLRPIHRAPGVTGCGRCQRHELVLS